tara:strand:+ start:590 stop:796 length:207 start_codon:yes stop_codon:yes gene_type:complete
MKFQPNARVVETPMGSTIDVLNDGAYWVCDREQNCREVRGLWEAEEFLREREKGFDYPYSSDFRTVND